jgi:hypothetical protein
MSDLIIMPRSVLEQALKALVMTQREAQIGEADYAIAALRARLAQQAEPVACKEQITVEELAAALGWPGGISSPVQDKAELLRIVAHARVAKQAEPEKGMTLRDYFAAKAMQGWLSSFSCESRHPTESGGAKYVAAASYAMADAMLAERNK